mgnify:CR=1 FL=1
MRSPIIEKHRSDDKYRPAGGVTSGRGFIIDWQDGPLAVDGVRREPNGAFVEDIVAAVIGRIEFYEASEFANGYNRCALASLREAAAVLDRRTKDREARGVEGTHQQ